MVATGDIISTPCNPVAPVGMVGLLESWIGDFSDFSECNQLLVLAERDQLLIDATDGTVVTHS